MENVFLIPTDKPSRLFIIDGKLYNYHKPQQGDGVNEINQNIYITSDEEITSSKDWFIDIKDNRNHLHQVGYSLDSYEWIEQHNPQYFKKIILTTDQDLIENGVQSIDDEFLEWFVKNPSCESVETVQVCIIGCDKLILNGENSICCGDKKYKIIIPQEEPKQEIVINEKCSKCGSSQYQIGKPFCTDEFCNTNIGKASEDYWLKQPYNEDAFVEGAKWQAERMYSEEEVLDLLNKREDYLDSEDNIFDYQSINQWFEQFKKK